MELRYSALAEETGKQAAAHQRLVLELEAAHKVALHSPEALCRVLYTVPPAWAT